MTEEQFFIQAITNLFIFETSSKEEVSQLLGLLIKNHYLSRDWKPDARYGWRIPVLNKFSLKNTNGNIVNFHPDKKDHDYLIVDTKLVDLELIKEYYFK